MTYKPTDYLPYDFANRRHIGPSPAEMAAMFKVLLAYSPLHNIQPGRAYPATLMLTGDHDDRVLPAHSYKFAAALQAAQGGPAPILLRVDVKTGHGTGKPTAKQIASAADRWSFLISVLGPLGPAAPWR